MYTEADSEADSQADSAAGLEAAPAVGEAPAGRNSRRRPFWKELPFLIGFALVLALLVKAFLVQAFYIPSASMENTLRIGDRVLVNKVVYHTRPIHRGDIVVFTGVDSWDSEAPSAGSGPLHAVGAFFGLVPGEKDYIKRVIGVAGDHVQSAGDGAPVLVNGHPLAEKSYLYPGNRASETRFDVVVPPGRIWVMGDHREVSADSRAHMGEPGGGTIGTGKVVGRAFVVVWPFTHATWLSVPSSFAATPMGLGAAGALPLTLLYRRLRRRR